MMAVFFSGFIIESSAIIVSVISYKMYKNISIIKGVQMLKPRSVLLCSSILLSCSMLAACGSDDSNSSVSNNENISESAYEFISFIIDDDSQPGLDGISYINRQNLRVTANGVMLTEYDVYGNSDLDDNEGPESILPSLILAKNLKYLSTNEFKNFKYIDNDTFEEIYKDEKTGETIIKTQIKNPIKISGASSKNISVTLDFLPRIANKGYNFPNGSLCYNYRNKSDKEYFEFDLDFPSEYPSLMAWKNDRSPKNGINPLFNTMMVGSDNEISVTYVTYSDDIDKDIDGSVNLPIFGTAPPQALAAVIYEGKLYEGTLFYPSDISSPTDPSVSQIFCLGYNKVAADYIEREIKNSYR